MICQAHINKLSLQQVYGDFTRDGSIHDLVIEFTRVHVASDHVFLPQVYQLLLDYRIAFQIWILLIPKHFIFLISLKLQYSFYLFVHLYLHDSECLFHYLLCLLLHYLQLFSTELTRPILRFIKSTLQRTDLFTEWLDLVFIVPHLVTLCDFLSGHEIFLGFLFLQFSLKT